MGEREQQHLTGILNIQQERERKGKMRDLRKWWVEKEKAGEEEKKGARRRRLLLERARHTPPPLFLSLFSLSSRPLTSTEKQTGTLKNEKNKKNQTPPTRLHLFFCFFLCCKKKKKTQRYLPKISFSVLFFFYIRFASLS